MIAGLARLFSEGFRVFFLAAGVFALLAVLYWEFYLGVSLTGGELIAPGFAPSPYLWHAHEMVFGYASAALGGFLLTAVPNWTGAKAARWRFIAPAAGLWFAGRLAVWFSGALPAELVAAIDLAFLPLMIAKIAVQLTKRPKPQNVAFVVFLSLLWIANLLVHLEWMGVTADTAANGLRGGLLSLCLMIGVLGGRVTPAFTRNAMNRAGLPEARLPVSRRLLDMPGLAALLLLTIAVLAGLPDAVAGILALVAGAFALARMAGWSTCWTLDQPILWSLHLAMACLGIGLMLWGASWLGIGSEIAALHLVGIGAVGGMTLAVMSRAVLGHTGRALVASRGVVLAYAAVAAAALLRWLASGPLVIWHMELTLISGAVWCLAFAAYLVAMLPALTGPRQQAG
ncbi:NnrS family protein [Thalassococcus sp. CAU 1522]|uniref:NnrS family protein n=1 Tax=Thalassococcus arenae TaxID=2851652 RepID=A0ABS6NC84_9RHOB|nr:NnrS family protein [Thalassococcus arenae]MBV2361641.1 NnrS family protein [Thalassococcus arenae]